VRRTSRSGGSEAAPPTTTTKRNASNLIGNIRIVPVWRQNALLVVGRVSSVHHRNGRFARPPGGRC
jgi:ribosomal protein L35AE/L33A